MSKTEEKNAIELMKKAKDFIPDGGYSEKELNLAFFMFIKGYRQAEKDLELTWKDINRIEIIIKDVYRDYPHGIEVKQFGTEVLKRFKAKKNVEQEV